MSRADSDKVERAVPMPAVPPSDRPADKTPTPTKIAVRDLDFFYGDFQALKHVTLDIRARTITALIGPSGCGKTTFLRAINRMNDTIRGARAAGRILIDDQDIYEPGTDVVELRRRVGMVFQRPNPFPQSVFDNVAFGPSVLGLANGRGDLAARVREESAGSGVVGRSEGCARGAGAGAQSRPAAAALHRAHGGDEPRDHLDGRALLGSGPGGHASNRKPDAAAGARIHDRGRHPQHAAGGPRFASGRVSSGSASWSSSIPPRRSSLAPRHP